MEITIEDLKTISDEEELKVMAPLEDIIKVIEKEIYPLSIHVNSYAEVNNVIKKLKNHWNTFQDDIYFQNKSARYIFALTHMEGKERNRIIELTEELYDDECRAKEWYRSVAKIIHPDMNQADQKNAEKAMDVLSEIYDRIKSCFNYDEED